VVIEVLVFSTTGNETSQINIDDIKSG